MPDTYFRGTRILAGTLLTVLLTGASTVFAASVLETSISEQTAIDRAAEGSQTRVDGLADETQNLLEEYLLVTQRTDRLRLYNDQLEKLIRSQEEEKISIQRQMEGIEIVEQEIIPLMIRMIDSLDAFIELDLPFLKADREARVERLRENMDSANFTVAEKYRQVMEAYQLETEYGRTVAAYRGALNLDGIDRNVDFLQVGRVMLAFQTLDGSESGYYTKQGGAWGVVIDDGVQFREAIDKGLRIARKQTAPDLLDLPIAAPEGS